MKKSMITGARKGSVLLRTIFILLLALVPALTTVIQVTAPASAFSSGWKSPSMVSESGSGNAWSYTTVYHPAYCIRTQCGWGGSCWCAEEQPAWTEYIYSRNNVTASDNQYATVILNHGESSTYIRTTNFGFNVPAGATITGIVVDIERQGAGCSGTAVMSDKEVKIINSSGSIVGDNKATATRYSYYGDVTESHGGITDRWGLTLSPSDVNSPNFGVALSVKNNDIGWCNQSAKIDHIRMAVYYTTPTATTLTSSANPATSGQTVTFTATVNNSATGTVQFKDGGSNLGSPVALSGGTATYSTASLSVASHSITAVYSGDSNFSVSTSSSLTQQVNNPSPVTTNISPASKNASDAGFIITVNGTGFMNGAVVYLNGIARTTTFISSTRLTATIPSGDLTRNGSRSITVNNPAPSNGPSNPQTLTVNKVPWFDTVSITGTVEAVIDVTAPDDFSISLMPGITGTSAAQSVTVKCNDAGWTLAVSGTNGGHMNNASYGNLANPIYLAGGDLSGYQPLTSPQNLENGSSGAVAGITTISGITFQQTPTWNDPVGDYTITVTFTGTIN